MKTFFIWMIAALSICMNTTAQGYGGRRGGYGGGGRGSRYGGSPTGMKSQSQSKDYSQICITGFPEITGLTLKQNLDLSTIVTDERKNILKLTDQKQELQVKADHAKDQKEVDKVMKKMTKLDDKMQAESLKADKKIQSILTNEQYKEFIEKKDQIKFGTLPTFRSGLPPSRPNNGNSERQGEFER